MKKDVKLRNFIATTIRQYLNENINNVNQILDKIRKYGQQDLTQDERVYLNQYNNNIDKDLEEWLFSDDENTFDLDGNKLLFDEFTDDEDILYNRKKIIRVITKHLKKNPFRNNADWGGGYVWNLKTNNNFVGTFLYLGDDELVIIKRQMNDDEYEDEEIKNITNSRELYNFFLSLKKE